MPAFSIQTMTRRQFMALALYLLAISKLTGCRASLPVLGKSPIPDPLVVEDHSQALTYWAKLGIRDAVLVNIDTHDDFRWIPESKIDALRGIYQRRDWQRFAASDTLADRGLFHIGNWIYAGARLGIFKEFYWVIPFNFFSQQDADGLLRKFLKSCGFNDEDLQTFALLNNRFHGKFRGIPITICDLESLPDINRPLLLSFCIDFFPMYSDAYKAPYLTALHTMFEALYAKNYQIQDAVVSYSVNGDYYLPPQLRWVGDTVTNILKKPGEINEAPSERLALLQEIDNAYRIRAWAEILRLTETGASQQTDPALLLYNAFGRMLQGDPDNALTAAQASFQTDRHYCTGLPYIGLIYHDKGKDLIAEKFFRAGVAANPNMRNGLFHFAHCLRNMGKMHEALAVYEKDESMSGSFPTHFMIFEIYLALGNRTAAVFNLKDAMIDLEKDSAYAHIVHEEMARAIYVALDFSEQNGFSEIAVTLRQYPVIKKMFIDFPRHKGRVKG